MSIVAVLDDSPLERRWIGSILDRSGQQPVEIVPDRIPRMMAALRRTRPDLILVDVHMPPVPTSLLLDLIREDPQLAHVPVLLVTADTDPASAPFLQRLASTGILFKPFKAKDMMQALQGLLQGWEEPFHQTEAGLHWMDHERRFVPMGGAACRA